MEPKASSRGFWGPNMNALLDRLESLGFPYHAMSPAHFPNAIDEYIGIKTNHKVHPEILAQRYLEELNGS